ncbi:helix-turn-helix domain-containing protein [Glutamicibacter creatinolyticus]|uniref:helix-turn-helix domain-containing protein n=1 Tax=Glutamicibacter creatinolyticus TaxID=162496 RepID=UPI0037BF06BF
MPEFYTPQEVAEMLKVSRQSVLSKIRSGDWECLRISERTYRFSQEQLDRIIAPPQKPSRGNEPAWKEALKRISR